MTMKLNKMDKMNKLYALEMKFPWISAWLWQLTFIFRLSFSRINIYCLSYAHSTKTCMKKRAEDKMVTILCYNHTFQRPIIFSVFFLHFIPELKIFQSVQHIVTPISKPKFGKGQAQANRAETKLKGNKNTNVDNAPKKHRPESVIEYVYVCYYVGRDTPFMSIFSSLFLFVVASWHFISLLLLFIYGQRIYCFSMCILCLWLRVFVSCCYVFFITKWAFNVVTFIFVCVCVFLCIWCDLVHWPYVLYVWIYAIYHILSNFHFNKFNQNFVCVCG